MDRFATDAWAIVPGPAGADDGTRTSLDAHELAEIEPGRIAGQVASLLGATVQQNGDWWDWTAAIERGDSWVLLKMTLMGAADDLWGGFSAECSDPGVLADVADELANAVEGVWLHSDDCQLWSPARFRREWCSPDRH